MPPQTPDIRREQGRNNYQSLYSHVTTHSKGLRPSSLTNFSTYIEWWCQSGMDISSLSSSQRWDVCLSLFQTTSISGVMFLGSPSLFDFCWKTVPLFFLTTLFKEKGHSLSQNFFLFFLYRVFININKFIYLSQTYCLFAHLNIIFMRADTFQVWFLLHLQNCK